MWKTIVNEWRFLYRSKTLLLLSLGFVLVLILCIVLAEQQHQKQNETYTKAKNELRDQWESIDSMNPHSAAHYGTYVFKPVNILSNLDEGITSATGNVLRVEGHVQNEMVHSEASQMMVASKFGKLKISLVLQYILPLILIFLAFNSIHSERQKGRLKLLVLQGSNPRRLLLSKVIANWCYGLILLAIVLIFYSIVYYNDLDPDTITRLGMFTLSYSLYYFIIVGLIVFIVARSRSAMLALTVMLGLWILWTIFIPNIILTQVEQWHPLPSRNDFTTAMREDRSKGIDGHNPSDERGKKLKQEVLEEYKVDSLSQLPINFDGIRMQADEEYGNIVWDKHFGNLDNVLKQQKQSLQYFGILNPFISLQNSSMAYTGNDNIHYQAFLRQVEDYRRVFIKTLNDKHTYGGSKTGNWSWKANNDFFKSIKDFSYQPLALKDVFTNYMIDICLLLLWSLVVLCLLIFGIKKMVLE